MINKDSEFLPAGFVPLRKRMGLSFRKKDDYLIRKFLLVSFVVLLQFLFCNEGLCRDWYVRPADSSGEEGDGTSTMRSWKGFRNIVWGDKGIREGDTLYLLPGIYHEQLRIKGSGKVENPVQIRCVAGGECIIDSGEKLRYLIYAKDVQHVVLSELTTRNAASAGIWFTGECTGITVKNCRSYNNKNYGIYFGNNKGTMRAIRIEGNDTFNNGQDDWGSGIFLRAAEQGLIEDVEIVENDCYDNIGRYGIGVYPNKGGQVCRVEVHGNTCYRNGRAGIEFSHNITDSSIHNNNCHHNGNTYPGAGIHVGGVKGASCSRIRIYSNECSHQIHQRKDGPGILVDDYTSHIEVSRNKTHQNEEAGIKLHNCSDITVFSNVVINNTTGITAPSARRYAIYNNNILGCPKYGVHIMRQPENVLLANNIIGMCLQAGIKYNGASRMNTNEKGNCFFANTQDAITDTEGNSTGKDGIIGAPGFVNLGREDFRLVDGSPCLNSGIVVPNLIGFYGKNLDDRTKPNIGVYQGIGVPNAVKKLRFSSGSSRVETGLNLK